MEEIINEILWLFENKPSYLSWSEVARRSGVDRRTVNNYVSGHYNLENIRLKYAHRLYTYSLKLQYELSNKKKLQDINGWEYVRHFTELQRCLDSDYFKDYRDYTYWNNEAKKLSQYFK